MNDETKKELNDEQLEKVSGGSWGHNIIHNEDEYNAAGITTKWSNNLFVTDKFYINGKQISDKEAASIVFYSYSHDSKLPKTISEAIEFKTNNVEAYNAFINNVNTY